MSALYNEIDKGAAAWLRELINAGHIAPGVVDERDIRDLEPEYVASFTQFHAFAGIGGWSLALRGAGWPDSRPIWTGSCPCQPFSAAGHGAGFDDERHLWPAFDHLIEICLPDVVLGEQVASALGLAWLDLVCADLEGSGYAVGAVDTCAAGFGAPHIRQRLYWAALLSGGVSVTDDTFGRTVSPEGNDGNRAHAGRAQGAGHAQTSGRDGGLDARAALGVGFNGAFADRDATARGLGHRDGDRSRETIGGVPVAVPGPHGSGVRPGPLNAFWRDADWLQCTDGGWRPTESGAFPLAHGVSARVGRLRGYGNAIVVPQASEFCAAVMEAVQ